MLSANFFLYQCTERFVYIIINQYGHKKKNVMKKYGDLIIRIWREKETL